MGSRALTDALFEADPREFVAARDRLSKQLRADGEREEAARIKALRRPSVAAWALNQVARHRPAAVRKLLETVEHARTAQDELLAGGDRGALRAALAERRHAMHDVLDAAREHLEASGRSPDTATREIESALQGAVDDAFITSLQNGELIDLEGGDGDDEDQLAGLLSASVREPPAPRVSPATEARRKKLADEVARLGDELEAATSRLRECDELVTRHERDLNAARAARDDAARARGRAETALERARAKLEPS